MAEQQHFIDRFRKDIISVHSSLELQKVMAAGHFQAIVVGSDQTWRPKYVPNVMDYWLDFAESYDILKVAYAPSLEQMNGNILKVKQKDVNLLPVDFLLCLLERIVEFCYAKNI